MRISTFSTAALAIVTMTSASAATLPPLQLGHDVTVSGISSGAYMAAQYHLSFSTNVKGVGLIAGGPWGCAQGDLSQALAHCMAKPDAKPDLSKARQAMDAAVAAGTLPALTAVTNTPVYILHGTLDQTVGAPVSDALAQQYQQLGAKVTYDNSRPLAHHFPTMATGTACDQSASPFLGHCQFDAAGALLNAILPALNPPAKQVGGTLMDIDQQALGGETASSIADKGFLYVPKQCAAGQACQLHIVFHGCKQNAEAIGDVFVKGTGLNEYADSNDLVVLYPQTKKSMLSPFNPNGCWDWWGYTGPNYGNSQGAQIKAVHNIAQALSKH